jgi:arylsulfatase A-like enzyme
MRSGAGQRRTTAMKRLPLFLLLTACGSESLEERFPAPRSLLPREPERILDQPGTIAPVAGTLFGRFSNGPFERELGQVDGHPLAWARTRRIRVVLPAIHLEDREIRLWLVLPPGGPPEGIPGSVTLNLQELGSFRASTELQELSFRAPADVWRHGENVLEIGVERVTAVDPERTLGFGLGRIEYARPRSIVVEPGALRMRSDTAVVYAHEPQTESGLVIEGRADGGRLEVHLRHVDPDTGKEVELGEPLRFDVRDGRVRGEVLLPASQQQVLETEIGWTASGEQELVIERLEVREPPGVRRSPVIFVSVDTLGAQHMSLYGLSRKTTPRLEELAEDAVVFERCRANAPWTVPSYMSQFTGLTASSHGGRGKVHVPPWEEYQLAANRWTLAESFRAAGYRTAAFVDNPWLRRGFGFAQGFELYDVSATERPHRDTTGGVDHVVPRALEWLDSLGADEPFFLFVQVFDTHAPYVASEPWKGTFDGDGLIDESWTIPVGFGQAYAYGCLRTSVMPSLFPPDPDAWPTEVAVAPFAAAYHEKVLQVDAGVGRFVDGLRERGLYDRCIFVFSADHGESTVQHDYFFDHSLLYEEVLHVPLLIKPPFAQRGRRVLEPVQLVDVYPTLLELAFGQPSQAHLHGRSILPLLEGEDLPIRPTFAEGGLFNQGAVEEGGWKLIVYLPKTASYQTLLSHPRLDRRRLAELAPELATGWHTEEEIARIVAAKPELEHFLYETMIGPVTELYYLPDDPGEQHDVAALHPDVVERLGKYLQQGVDMGRTAKSKASVLPVSPDLSEDEIRELRDLGYGGG